MKWITNYRTLWILPLLGALALTACENRLDELQPEASRNQEEDFSEYTGEYVHFDIEASLPNTPVGASTRALKEENGVIQIDYSKMLGPVTVHLALRNKTTREITYKSIPNATIAFINGTYQLICDGASLQLKRGFFNDAAWEVCALIDPRNKVQNGIYTNVEFNTLDYLSPNANYSSDALESMEVPLYSRYQDVITNAEGKKVLRLYFKPLGTVISATLTNPFYTDITFTRITLNSDNVIAGDVVLNFGNELPGTGLPQITTTRNSKVCSFAFKKAIQTQDLKEAKAYLWCIPTSPKAVQPDFDVYYKILLSEDPDSTEYISPKTLSQGFENSKNYRIRIELPESDLMITEVGHLNPSGWNYSYVEIFNPTNRTIDLWQYGLVRVLEWNKESSDPTEAIWQNSQSMHTYGPFDNALVQSLHLATIHDPIWTVGGVNANSSGSPRNSYSLMYVNKMANERYTNNHVLEPGKCILVFAGGTRELIARNYGNRYKYFPSGEKCFNSSYLPNAVLKGYCKYVIAVDNGLTQNAYAGIGSSGSTQAGVMQNGRDHSMILVKRDQIDSGKFHILDAQMGTINRTIFTSFSNMLGATLTSGDDWTWFGRFPNVMYPLTLKPAKQYSIVPIILEDGTVRNGEGTFMDWRFFIQPWTDFPHRTSPGTRYPLPEVDNGGIQLPGAPLERD